MSLFIKVISKHDDQDKFNEVEQKLIDSFGYNDAYWRNEQDEISVYYKDIHEIESILYR